MDALVTVKQTLYGKAVANVCGFANVQSGSTWLQDFADDFRDKWGSWLVAHMINDWSLDGIAVSLISGAQITDTFEVDFTAGPLVGLASADGMPSTDAMVVSLRSVGGDPKRGRVYLTGWNELAHNNSRWSSNTLSDASNMIQGLVDGVGPAGAVANMVIVGRPKAGRPAHVSSAITNIIPREIVATQRRRRLKA